MRDRAWHPKKNRIVSQCEIDGRFQLVTINSDGSDPKVITSTRGPLAGRRIVRGREDECRRHYRSA